MTLSPDAPERPISPVLARNIEALNARRREDRERATLQVRVAEKVTRFSGSMAFVYIHLVIVALWVTTNLGWIPGLPRFDKSFVILAMAASVEAIFLSTFVLISQNRMADAANRRDELDLQVNLLAEHEITRIIDLLVRISERLDVKVGDPDLEEARKDVAPETVLDELERRKSV